MTHHDHSAFGADTFGQLAERLARFFGTPKYIVGQSIIVVLWIVANVVVLANGWDPYPFILLNLAFSTQAAYAAPLILLASTRQADRDKHTSEADAAHREEIASDQRALLDAVHDKVRDDTPGGLQVVVQKLDELIDHAHG